MKPMTPSRSLRREMAITARWLRELRADAGRPPLKAPAAGPRRIAAA